MMQHTKYDKIKILIAETSTILRNGIRHTLESVLDCPVIYMELTDERPISEVVDFSPEIVIMNPQCSYLLNISELKQELSEIYFIALITGPMDPRYLKSFDASINIYNTPDEIHNTLDKLMGYDHPYSAKEAPLTEREREIIINVVKGLANKEIANELNLSTYTVITHRRNIAKKLQIRSASALTIYAITNKLVRMEEVKV